MSHSVLEVPIEMVLRMCLIEVILRFTELYQLLNFTNPEAPAGLFDEIQKGLQKKSEKPNFLDLHSWIYHWSVYANINGLRSWRHLLDQLAGRSFKGYTQGVYPKDCWKKCNISPSSVLLVEWRIILLQGWKHKPQQSPSSVRRSSHWRDTALWSHV